MGDEASNIDFLYMV